MNLQKKKELIEELYRRMNVIIGTRENINKIEEYYKTKNISEAVPRRLLNANAPLEALSDVDLCILTTAVYNATNMSIFSPRDYFNKEIIELEKLYFREDEKIDSISEIINQSLTELRALSKSLTDDTINSKNIIDLIQQEVDKINELKKCVANFTYNEKNIKLDYQVKSVLYRIIQEFIQNSLKHSGCKNIMINLESNHNQVKLKVEDDGIGFDINRIRSKGIGLKNMKKRAKIIHADFKIESRINKGTQLIISIPNE